MVSRDKTERILAEESSGPSDLESVLMADTLKEVQVDHGILVDELTSLYEAVGTMRKSKGGCVLVTRERKLTGILTEHDVLMKIVDTGIDLERTPVSTYMTRDPVALPDDAGVAYALNNMVVEGFHRLPLVDQDGRPTGIVSMHNIIEYLSTYFPRDVLNLPPDPTKKFRRPEGA